MLNHIKSQRVPCDSMTKDPVTVDGRTNYLSVEQFIINLHPFHSP